MAARIPAPLELSVLSTYARSFAELCMGPAGGTQLPVLASAVVPAGQARQRCKRRPASMTVLITVPDVVLEHWHVPAAVRVAGFHAVLMENPFWKLVSLPLLGSHSTQLSWSADGTKPAACERGKRKGRADQQHVYVQACRQQPERINQSSACLAHRPAHTAGTRGR